MAIYGNNAAIHPFGKIRDLSMLMGNIGTLTEETMKNSRPNDEEDGLLRRFRRYKMARRAAIIRLKKPMGNKD